MSENLYPWRIVLFDGENYVGEEYVSERGLKSRLEELKRMCPRLEFKIEKKEDAKL